MVNIFTSTLDQWISTYDNVALKLGFLLRFDKMTPQECLKVLQDYLTFTNKIHCNLEMEHLQFQAFCCDLLK